MIGPRGFLKARLQYLRNKENKKKAKTTQPSNDASMQSPNSSIMSDGDVENELMRQVLSMKSIVVNEENMASLVEKLKVTRKFRRSLLKKPEVQLKEYFPYFFTHPDLVSIRRDINYPLFKYFSVHGTQILRDFAEQFDMIDCSVLISKWIDIKGELNRVLETQYSSDVYTTEWAEEVDDTLILLKLFPLKKVGKNPMASRETFFDARKKLIKFYDVNERTNIFNSSYEYINIHCVFLQ